MWMRRGEEEPRAQGESPKRHIHVLNISVRTCDGILLATLTSASVEKKKKKGATKGFRTVDNIQVRKAFTTNETVYIQAYRQSSHEVFIDHPDAAIASMILAGTKRLDTADLALIRTFLQP